MVLVPFEKKKLICEANKELLNLVYEFGNGIMYKQHIQRYFSEFEGIHEIDISKRLLELKNNEIIDFQNIFGAKVVKLKKFAVCFLLGKEREAVSSINFTMMKVKKSAFLNQIILDNADLFKTKWATLEDLRKPFLKATTYFSKQKETYIFLQRQSSYTVQWVEDEIRKLISHKEKAIQFKETPYKVKNNEFNLNSMQASNIFFGIKRIGVVRPTQPIHLLDLNGLMTPNKLASKINNTVDYLDALFDREKLDFQFDLFVHSDERRSFLLKSKKKIDKLIWDHCKREISWGVVDLNLENTLFRGQKVLLNV